MTTIATEGDAHDPLLSPDSSLNADAFNYRDLLRAQRGLQQLRTHGGRRDVTAGIDSGEAGGDGGGEGAHGHGHDVAPLGWYAPPVQRQRWGEDQEHAHVPWNDLFYDLFYVAAAFNLATLLKSALSAEQITRGVLYYLGAFGALWGTWETSMTYAARYATHDAAHHAVEMLRMLFVGLAICFVTKVEYLGDPAKMDAMMFILLILLEFLIQLGLNVELYFKGVGDRLPIKNHTMTEIKMHLLPVLLLYLAAFISAVVYHRQSDGDDGHGMTTSVLGPAPTTTPDDAYGDKDSGDKYESETQPVLTAHDIPFILMFVAYVFGESLTTWRKFRATSGKHGALRDIFIPENIDYMIHRYGEWMMLMLGEAILSLATADVVHTKDYYLIIVFGILTMITIAADKFGDEPHGKHHAMWQGLSHQICYSIFTQFLSFSLIAFGGSYKLFMKDAIKGNTVVSYGYSEKGGVTAVWAANYFGITLGWVILSLQLLSWTHKGFNYYWSKSCSISLVIIQVALNGLIALAVNLAMLTVEPHILTVLGFVIAVLLGFLRSLEVLFFSSDGDSAEDEARTDVRYWRLIGATVNRATVTARASVNHSFGSGDQGGVHRSPSRGLN